jgi:DNA-binding NtrC family response regulator
MGSRILVIDDEADVQDVVIDFLTAGGYEVDAVATVQQALDAVNRRPYDLIISDRRLPGGGGDALATEIVRRHPGLAGRIILLTGELAEPRGPLPVIQKPFDLDTILRAVQTRLPAA